MMTSREKQLRVAHYVSEDPITVAGTAENKGAYTELMLWYTSLFDFKLNDNSGDQDE